jgi:hypothetical protein
VPVAGLRRYHPARHRDEHVRPILEQLSSNGGLPYVADRPAVSGMYKDAVPTYLGPLFLSAATRSRLSGRAATLILAPDNGRRAQAARM